MPNRSHWTPRYLLDRISWEVYQRRHPEEPWLTPDAIAMLSTLLLPSDTGIEWGSGRSTCWLARRLASLTSVEHVPEWHRNVTEMLRRQHITNVTYRLEPHPGGTDIERCPYVDVVDTFPPASLGFALVDGESRVFCALRVLDKLKPGGVLVIDNINWYLDHPTRSPSSRAGVGPANAHWGELAERLQGWRHVWTTSGVTDTAIWFKPAGPTPETGT